MDKIDERDEEDGSRIRRPDVRGSKPFLRQARAWRSLQGWKPGKAW